MKLIIVVLSFSCMISLYAQEKYISLFNGKTLVGWNSARNPDGDSHGVFSVDSKKKSIHVYAKLQPGSEQVNDLLYTDLTFSNYILKLEYQWGENRFTPRADWDRDAGILFHVADDVTKGWKGWPSSIEMQIGESPSSKVHSKEKGKRFHTGDAWIIGLENIAEISKTDNFYDPEGPIVTHGKERDFSGCWTKAGTEKAHGKWNEIEIRVEGNKQAVFFLNGEEVMKVLNMKKKEGEIYLPLSTGRIGLQAEYAEIYYRNIRIKELKHP